MVDNEPVAPKENAKFAIAKSASFRGGNGIGDLNPWRHRRIEPLSA
jgi:hypothetical protein